MYYKNELEPSTVSRIEKGQVEAKYLTLKKLARAYGKSMGELLDFEE